MVFLIADFELEDLKDIQKYITKWQIKEKSCIKHVLTDLMEFCIIELPKVRKYNENMTLDTWVNFMKNPEVIDMSDNNENESLKNAKKVLEDISNNERERYLAELRQKYIMDQKAIVSKGFNKGKKEGIEEGIKQGEKEGIEQHKIEVAKRMLKSNCDIQLIIEITELSKETIDEISKNINNI